MASDWIDNGCGRLRNNGTRKGRWYLFQVCDGRRMDATNGRSGLTKFDAEFIEFAVELAP